MAVARRDKLVYFRLSGEEFEEILTACHAREARSVSDFARMAVQQFIKAPNNEADQQMTEIVTQLQTLIDDLKQTIQQLTPTTTQSRATGAADVSSDQ
jgi:signal transduction histidine kinase